MEQTVNIPIYMISVCNTVGELRPVRFKFETEDHQLIQVDIEEILSFKETSFNGIKELLFTCSASIGERFRLFILKYNVQSHKWLMFKLLT